VLTAVAQAQTQQGLISDCKIQDLRDVDVSLSNANVRFSKRQLLTQCFLQLVTAKILDNDIPVLVLSFRTQEVVLFRNAISKEIVFGKEVCSSCKGIHYVVVSVH
jgi:import inner membrane translocase subunit TIM44